MKCFGGLVCLAKRSFIKSAFCKGVVLSVKDAEGLHRIKIAKPQDSLCVFFFEDQKIA